MTLGDTFFETQESPPKSSRTEFKPKVSTSLPLAITQPPSDKTEYIAGMRPVFDFPFQSLPAEKLPAPPHPPATYFPAQPRNRRRRRSAEKYRPSQIYDPFNPWRRATAPATLTLPSTIAQSPSRTELLGREDPENTLGRGMLDNLVEDEPAEPSVENQRCIFTAFVLCIYLKNYKFSSLSRQL